MLQAFALGILVVTGTVELWHVYALAFMLGTINAFDGPVRQAFGVELVGREQVVNAVALNSSIFNMARIAGPAVAGIAIATVGMSTAFLLNAASYIAVLGAYAIMRPDRILHRAQAAGRPVTSSPRFARGSHTPSTRLASSSSSFSWRSSAPLASTSPFSFRWLPNSSSKSMSSTSVSSHPRWAPARCSPRSAWRAVGRLSVRGVIVAAGAFIVVFVGIAVSQSYYLTAAFLLVLGVASVLFSTTINTTLQITVPDELRGRVMSIFFLLFAGSTPVGGYLTGVLAETFRGHGGAHRDGQHLQRRAGGRGHLPPGHGPRLGE